MRTRLAIVGAGPSCTYVLERISALCTTLPSNRSLEIRVFERSGEFGAGLVHSARQPRSSFLNRIAGQVAFAADETVVGAGELLPPEARLPLDAWARAQFAETGNEDFNLQPEDWPKRYVHGAALRWYFTESCERLRSSEGVTIELLQDEVVDIDEREGTLWVVTSSRREEPYSADHVLFLTGHSSNDPRRALDSWELVEFAERTSASYVPSAYPLDVNICRDEIGTETVVACHGSGLTALDVILYLTEGRDGVFQRNASGGLDYKPSGTEPALIVPISQSGMLTFARPFNAKEVDLTRFEHRGVFLTHECVDRLRESYGLEMDLGRSGVRKQLDFETTLWPVTLLEMAFLSYRTLLGHEFGQAAEARVLPVYESLLDGRMTDLGKEERIDTLLAPLQGIFAEAAVAIDAVMADRCDLQSVSGRDEASYEFESVFRRYLAVVFGDTVDAEQLVTDLREGRSAQATLAGRDSPWRHPIDAKRHQFSWAGTITPLLGEDVSSPEAYVAALDSFMRRDHLWADQGNLCNPAKAAADGVWRDLRQTLAYAADFGGFTAESHREFIEVYMRHHNRLANGAALEVMEKMLALMDHGLVDMSAGPEARIECDGETGRFRLVGPVTGANIMADCVIDAKVHPFDPKRDVMPLYQNLLETGLVRKWKNPGRSRSYEPGGLDLDERFHPVGRAGKINRMLTFLGPPTEGIMFFQLGALRPQQNHHVMEDILAWLHEFWSDVTGDTIGPLDANTRPRIPER